MPQATPSSNGLGATQPTWGATSPQVAAAQHAMPQQQMQPAYSQGQALGRAIRLPGAGETEWLNMPNVQEADLSSIHVLSPAPVSEQDPTSQQDILEHCRDTAKLVKQLASVLKGLEADVESLRRENRSLRKTVIPGPAPAGQPEESQLPMQSARPSLASAGEQEDQEAANVASQSSGQQPNPLQTRSTPPPSARLAQPALAAQERMLGLHSSPHFGQAAPPPITNKVASVGQAQQPQTPSPAKRSALPSAGGQPLGGSRGPTLQPPGGGEWGASPQTDVSPALDSTATLQNVAPDTSALGDITAVPMSPSPAAEEATPGPWSVEQTIWLGGEGSVEHLVGKVRIMERDTIVSASAAVEGLNRGTFKCGDDVCVVFSASAGGYHLLYRQGQREKAMAVAAGEVPFEEAARDANARVMVHHHAAPTPSHSRNPGGPTYSACAVRVQAPQAPSEPAAGALSDRPEDKMQAIKELAEASETAQAEELLWQVMQSGVKPTEECFEAVVTALCKQGVSEKVEDVMRMMKQCEIRPPKEVFDKVIAVFSEQKNPAKVEEWLLNAGNSGWTPEQAAFESVVRLFADVDAERAEEWLSRSQATVYQLPDSCYDAVTMRLCYERKPFQAEEVLFVMKSNNRTPSDGIIQEVLNTYAEVYRKTSLEEAMRARVMHLALQEDNPKRAERAAAFLDLMTRGSAAVDDMRAIIIDGALQGGEIQVAASQLLNLSEPDTMRAQQVAARLAEMGETKHAQEVLEHFSLSGEANPELSLISDSAGLDDADGAQVRADAEGVATIGSPGGARRAGREAANGGGPGMRQPSQVTSARRNSQQRPSVTQKKATPSTGTNSPKAVAAKAVPRRSGPMASTARGRTAMNTR